MKGKRVADKNGAKTGKTTANKGVIDTASKESLTTKNPSKALKQQISMKANKGSVAGMSVKDSSITSKVPKAKNNNRSREIGSPKGSMFNDISSIMDLPM